MPNVVSGNSGYLVVSPVSSPAEESLGDRNHPIQDHPSTTALYSAHVGGQSMSKCILSKTQERQNERINIVGQKNEDKVLQGEFTGQMHSQFRGLIAFLTLGTQLECVRVYFWYYLKTNFVHNRRLSDC